MSNRMERLASVWTPIVLYVLGAALLFTDDEATGVAVIALATLSSIADDIKLIRRHIVQQGATRVYLLPLEDK